MSKQTNKQQNPPRIMLIELIISIIIKKKKRLLLKCSLLNVRKYFYGNQQITEVIDTFVFHLL